MCVCFLDFSRYYSNIIIFLNNSRLYSNENLLTKISLPFIVISNGIVFPLVLLGPDFENSGILESISKIKNYQNNFERSKIEILKTKAFLNIESKYAPPYDVILSATKPVFVHRYSPLKSKLICLGQKKLIFRFFEWTLFAKLKKTLTY